MRGGDSFSLVHNVLYRFQRKACEEVARNEEQREAYYEENDKRVLEIFSEYVTWNRVSNVLSHIGTVTAKDFGRVMGLTMKDIINEAAREGHDMLFADNPSAVKKEITTLIQNTIRSKWHEVLE